VFNKGRAAIGESFGIFLAFYEPKFTGVFDEFLTIGLD
jgi:hypothetical protein